MHYAILRILLALFCLYFAWPALISATTAIELIFWSGWFGFLLLIIGANLANLLQIIQPPIMEQELEKVKRHMEH